MIRAAQRGDWQTLPLPDQRQSLDLPLALDEQHAARLRLGGGPAGSDDRWFVFVEDDFVYFHRSWTGACIFGARLIDDSAGGARLTDCWVSRDEAYYESSAAAADAEAFTALLRMITDYWDQ